MKNSTVHVCSVLTVEVSTALRSSQSLIIHRVYTKDIITVKVFGYLILTSIDFYNDISLFLFLSYSF